MWEEEKMKKNGSCKGEREREIDEDVGKRMWEPCSLELDILGPCQAGCVLHNLLGRPPSLELPHGLASVAKHLEGRERCGPIPLADGLVCCAVYLTELDVDALLLLRDKACEKALRLEMARLPLVWTCGLRVWLVGVWIGLWPSQSCPLPGPRLARVSCSARTTARRSP